MSLARQPIFDRGLHVWGYELLYRAVGESTTPLPSGDTVTARVVVDALLKLGHDRIVGNALALLNVPRVPRELLLGDLPLLLPPERVALEVLEDIDPDASVVCALERVRALGFMILLDDFRYSDAWQPTLELAHVVKLEVNGRDRADLEKQLEALRQFSLRLLAEKVETHEELELCRSLGFHYFQGFFFARPRLVERSATAAASLAKLQLAAALQEPGLDFDDLARIVARDLALSYRLLRYINSAFFSLPRRVHAIREALVILGQETFRRWAATMVLAGVEGKPSELLTLALTRARMCELLAVSAGRGEDSGAFITGLFSVLDALADQPLADILAELPLAEDVVSGILRHEGEQGAILASVIEHERVLVSAPPNSSLDPPTVSEAYLDAVAWASAAAAGLA